MCGALRAANRSCYALAILMLRRVVVSMWHGSASLIACAVIAALVLPGCGRKATREDCEVVVDRNVELQLKALGVTDPSVVAKRREEMRASMREDIDKCVGKRVTDGMMACVKTAETAEKIDKCLR
jgi:hypothetical protein